jgi:hypothetical protein
MKKLLLIALLIYSPIKSEASGCMWFSDYTLGKKLQSTLVEGHFDCKIKEGWTFCSFSEGGRKYEYIGLQKAALPPSNTPMKIIIDEYEAMEWENCDGEDSAPEYLPNGTLRQFQYNERLFRLFQPSRPK